MVTLTKRAKKSLPLCVLITFFISCVIINPKRYIASVLGGLSLFASNVLPALFPFFFFTKLLSSLGFGEVLGGITKKPVSLLYNSPPISGYVLTMSMLSGYPVGARLLSDLYQKDLIDTRTVKKISSFTSTSGPLFVVGTVGTLMFGNASYGYIMLAGHFIGSLLNGFIYRGKKSTTAFHHTPHTTEQSEDILGSSVYNAIISILIVGSYIAIFGLIIDIMIDYKLIDTIAFPLQKLLELFGQPSQIASGIVISLVEITRGSQVLSQCGVDIKTILPWTASLLSFGGVSIALQSLTFLHSCKVKTSFFFVTKATQAILTFIVTWGLIAILY